MLGASFTLVGISKFYMAIINLAILPFADITLLTSNTATGMLCAQIFAVLFLGEAYICRYDLTALIFIVSGSVLTVLQSDLTEKSFDSVQVASLLTS